MALVHLRILGLTADTSYWNPRKLSPTSIELNYHKPSNFLLEQNYPNPFNPSTTIRYNLPNESKVKLILFNILGEEIRILVDEFNESGVHTIDVDGRDLNSGIYLYKIEAGTFVQTRKMILLK